jgi:outer membrane protein
MIWYRLKMVLAIALISIAGNVIAFDLDEAYRRSLSFNADYLAQIAATNAGVEVQNQALSLLLPQISANAAYSQNYLSSFGMTVTYTQPSFGGQFQQIILDFGKFSTYTKSKFAAEVANLQLTNARQKLMVNVAQAYFDILYAVDNLNAIRMNKDAFLAQMEQAQKSFDAGTVTVADVNDAKANYDSAAAQTIQAENNLMNRKTIFHNMTGLNPDLVQPLIDQIILELPSPESASAWSDMMKAANLNVKIARSQLNMAEEDILIARSGHYPSLSFMGNYQMFGTSNINSADSATTQAYFNQLSNIPGIPSASYSIASVGLQLSIPIASGGGINSAIRAAIANYEAAQDQLTSTLRQSDQLIINAFYQVLNGVGIVRAQTQALKSAKLKLDSSKTGYKLGIRNSVDLVMAQNEYAKALLSYNQARYQYLTYRLQLEYLAGKIDIDFIHLINNNILQ